MPPTAPINQTVETVTQDTSTTHTTQRDTARRAQFQARMSSLNIPLNGTPHSINTVVQRVEAGGQHPVQRKEDFKYLQRTIGNQAVIQLLDRMKSAETADIHKTAAAGVQGTGSPLPHVDKIQQSFGQHDIRGVQAFTGTKAASASKAIGAEAYTTGNKIAFSSPSPDLHTTAHEATHVLQQRGGVQLNGGVGEVGDSYERHADAVADKVVKGQSAEGLLNKYRIAQAPSGYTEEGIENSKSAVSMKSNAIQSLCGGCAGEDEEKHASGEAFQLKPDSSQAGEQEGVEITVVHEVTPGKTVLNTNKVLEGTNKMMALYTIGKLIALREIREKLRDQRDNHGTPVGIFLNEADRLIKIGMGKSQYVKDDDVEDIIPAEVKVNNVSVDEKKSGHAKRRKDLTELNEGNIERVDNSVDKGVRLVEPWKFLKVEAVLHIIGGVLKMAAGIALGVFGAIHALIGQFVGGVSAIAIGVMKWIRSNAIQVVGKTMDRLVTVSEGMRDYIVHGKRDGDSINPAEGEPEAKELKATIKSKNKTIAQLRVGESVMGLIGAVGNCISGAITACFGIVPNLIKAGRSVGQLIITLNAGKGDTTTDKVEKQAKTIGWLIKLEALLSGMIAIFSIEEGIRTLAGGEPVGGKFGVKYHKDPESEDITAAKSVSNFGASTAGIGIAGAKGGRGVVTPTNILTKDAKKKKQKAIEKQKAEAKRIRKTSKSIKSETK